ncbi:diguanylate cyclase domain-containing protein [Parahaliea mediterranea]|uniref:diguanylate cyclase domain-containing protein n=1 Tax=Parahaliea mediterranea TaxID=651086 RepID=UPI001300A996|nr:diguanylate cyclase [Parahaliea mediterranea]
MTTTTRTRVAAVAVILLGGLLLATFCAQRFYQQSMDQLSALGQGQLARRADLQWLIYQQDTPALQRLLQHLTRHPAIARGDIYSGTQDLLASHPAGRAAALDAVRGDASLNATVLQGIDSQGSRQGSGFFSTLLRPGTRIHLNVPVITRLNPDAKGLSGDDFLRAASSAGHAGSDIVMGYVDLAIDPAALHRPSLTQALLITLGCWLLAGIAALVLLYDSRARAAQLRRATGIIDRLAQGEREIAIAVDGSDINNALHRLVHSLGRYTQEIETGKNLLSRKVQERTHQLSRSHQELSRASEAVSESRARLQRLTYYDHLTTLPNRQLFLEQLGLLLRLSRRAGQHLALLHVDLANFRQVNEVQGFHAGDLLLREVARRLKACVRDSDAVATVAGSAHDITVSRLGGDEFTVILNHLDTPASAEVVAGRILGQLGAPLAVDGHLVTVKTRIGIACFPEHGDSAEALLKAAAIALGRAKATPDTPIALCQASWLDAGGDTDADAPWREALTTHGLALRYTPVVDTVMGSVVCLHATLSLQATPADNAAEAAPHLWGGRCHDGELTRALFHWQLQQACAELAHHGSSSRQPARVALWLGPGLCSEALVAQVQAVLEQTSLPAAQLELCLDEAILAQGRSLDALANLQALGVYLSVTGFGLGPTSLQQLGDAHLQALHIAPAFAPRYGEHSDNGAVRALVAIARSHNMEPVANGVASAAHYHYLAPQGVRQMSGALFGEHLPADQAAHLLAPWHFIEQIRKLGTGP